MHDALAQFFELPEEGRDLPHLQELFIDSMKELINKEKTASEAKGREACDHRCVAGALMVLFL